MPFTVYILFSNTIQKYYTGFTSMSVESRLSKHNSNHSGFTGKANDWKVIYTKETDTKSEAIKLEKSIKKRGAKRYLGDLSK